MTRSTLLPFTFRLCWPTMTSSTFDANFLLNKNFSSFTSLLNKCAEVSIQLYIVPLLQLWTFAKTQEFWSSDNSPDANSISPPPELDSEICFCRLPVWHRRLQFALCTSWSGRMTIASLLEIFSSSLSCSFCFVHFSSWEMSFFDI